MTDITILWDEALARYNSSTGYNLKDATTFKPTSSAELFQHLTSSRDAFAVNKEKGAKLRNVLKGPLQTIEVLGGVIGDAASTVRNPF
ncbi:hypothetical protein ABW20_dc0108422 [Dactylellina cionopaga]|nr:hypothetical protein ABW20_dc0108422 [Dactylellina cionopaga]